MEIDKYRILFDSTMSDDQEAAGEGTDTQLNSIVNISQASEPKINKVKKPTFVQNVYGKLEEPKIRGRSEPASKADKEQDNNASENNDPA